MSPFAKLVLSVVEGGAARSAGGFSNDCANLLYSNLALHLHPFPLSPASLSFMPNHIVPQKVTPQR